VEPCRWARHKGYSILSPFSNCPTLLSIFGSERMQSWHGDIPFSILKLIMAPNAPTRTRREFLSENFFFCPTNCFLQIIFKNTAWGMGGVGESFGPSLNRRKRSFVLWNRFSTAILYWKLLLQSWNSSKTAASVFSQWEKHCVSIHVAPSLTKITVALRVDQSSIRVDVSTKSEFKTLKQNRVSNVDNKGFFQGFSLPQTK